MTWYQTKDAEDVIQHESLSKGRRKDIGGLHVFLDHHLELAEMLDAGEPALKDLSRCRWQAKMIHFIIVMKSRDKKTFNQGDPSVVSCCPKFSRSPLLESLCVGKLVACYLASLLACLLVCVAYPGQLFGHMVSACRPSRPHQTRQ